MAEISRAALDPFVEGYFIWHLSLDLGTTVLEWLRRLGPDTFAVFRASVVNRDASFEAPAFLLALDNAVAAGAHRIELSRAQLDHAVTALIHIVSLPAEIGKL